MQFAGKDASHIFNGIGHSERALAKFITMVIGRVDDRPKPKAVAKLESIADCVCLFCIPSYNCNKMSVDNWNQISEKWDYKTTNKVMPMQLDKGLQTVESRIIENLNHRRTKHSKTVCIRARNHRDRGRWQTASTVRFRVSEWTIILTAFLWKNQNKLRMNNNSDGICVNKTKTKEKENKRRKKNGLVFSQNFYRNYCSF